MKKNKKRKNGCKNHGDTGHKDLLYFAWQEHRQDELKVGITNDDEARLADYNNSSVSSGNWVFAEVWSFPCQAQKIEAMLLLMFANFKIGNKKEYYYRSNGELDIFLEMRIIVQGISTLFTDSKDMGDSVRLDDISNYYGPKNQMNFFNIVDSESDKNEK